MLKKRPPALGHRASSTHTNLENVAAIRKLAKQSSMLPMWSVRKGILNRLSKNSWPTF